MPDQVREKEPVVHAAGMLPTNPQPVACIVIGMAGSGKTTLMQRLAAYLYEAKCAPYVVNLDPAVSNLPFGTNIDIRDTVDYKKVMKEYNLGPNGGIITSLNLFATRFDQVLQFIEKRAPELKYVLVDTPGQIEIFTWSASGSIITESLAASMPAVVVYVIDTVRSTSPTTFMSNMLYACSVMYKTKLPFVGVFNKIDVVSHEFAMEWMTDFDKFSEALDADRSSYMSSLTRSMALVLDEFYRNIKTVGVSAVTGQGMPEFFAAVDSARDEYFKFYKPELDRKISQKARAEEVRRKKQLDRLKADLETKDITPTHPPSSSSHPLPAPPHPSSSVAGPSQSQPAASSNSKVSYLQGKTVSKKTGGRSSLQRKLRNQQNDSEEEEDVLNAEEAAEYAALMESLKLTRP